MNTAYARRQLSLALEYLEAGHALAAADAASRAIDGMEFADTPIDEIYALFADGAHLVNATPAETVA